MARTRVWATEEAGYTDATLATSIDNKGTEARVDIREVVNQLIGVAEATALADPAVNQTTHTINALATAAAATAPLATTATLKRLYSAFSFTWDNTYLYDPTLGSVQNTGANAAGTRVPDQTVANGYVLASGLNAGNAIPLKGHRDLGLPVGVTLTEITATFWRVNAADQITVKLFGTVLSTGVCTELGSVLSTGTTTGSIQTAAMSLVDVTTLNTTAYHLSVTSSTGAHTTGPRFYGLTLDYTSPSANARF
jgi:hypothetical protein